MLAISDTYFSLLTVAQLSVTIYSHSRDAFGNPYSNGAPVLLSFMTIEELCIYIKKDICQPFI